MNRPTVRPARPDEIAQWDSLLTHNPDGGEIFQTTTIAAIKQRQGWTVEYWVYELSDCTVYATVLSRRLLPFGRLAYVIRGPGVGSVAQLKEIIAANQTWQKKYFAIKLEPPVIEHRPLSLPPALHAAKAIQPNVHTIWVDLTPDEPAIQATFRQRARRELRAAEKEGIVVKEVPIDPSSMEQMYALYRETADRAGFFIRPIGYYVYYWTKFAGAGQGKLFFAYAADDATPIAGAYIIRLGDKAVYKDGGSRRSAGKHFAHLLQWQIMRQLKREGVSRYDLHGVPPSEQINDPNHPLAGLAMFKLSFAQDVTDYIGAYDQVFDPAVYARWQRYGERLHRAYQHRVRRATLY